MPKVYVASAIINAMDLSNAKVDDYYLVGVNDHDGQGPVFTKVRDLMRNEIDEVITAKTELERWLRVDHQTFSLVEYSHKKLIETVERLINDFQTVPRPSIENATLAVNHELLDLLAMMNMYLDHTSKKLKNEYESTEFVEFEKATAHEFDTYFSYKFFYKLRNYALHAGFPIQKVDYSSEEDINGIIKTEVYINFDRNELLRNSDKWGAIVKPALVKMPEMFALMPLAEEVIDSLRSIRSVVSKNMLPRLKKYVTLFEDMQSSVPKKVGAPLVVRIKSKEKNVQGEKIEMQLIEIPDVELQLYRIFSQI